MKDKKTKKEGENVILTPQDCAIKMIKKNKHLRKLMDEFKLELI